MNTTTTVLAPQFSLGDADELRALLESMGFAEVMIADRAYRVRQPRNPQLIAQILASVSGVIPALAALNMEERAALAEAVEGEIGQALQNYVKGDEQLYPVSTHIALARKR